MMHNQPMVPTLGTQLNTVNMLQPCSCTVTSRFVTLLIALPPGATWYHRTLTNAISVESPESLSILNGL
eukprot:1005513-Amorphochlora_amoeboformis.AAC.1